MFRRAQDRIRLYYYKTKEDLNKDKTIPTDRVHFLFNELQNRLKLAQFHGFYFDRRKPESLCDQNGEFVCQGRWNKDQCLYSPKHQINPYSSKEGRVVFQTWNLDHIIERSRSVIPEVKKALKKVDVESETGPSIDIKAIYNDLFTLNNLKFVHIVCHDKGMHEGKKAGPYLMY